MSGCIFGPVPSRRLGRSLGIDLVPFKTCTYDCVYCQLGRTTRKTIERKQWVRREAVTAELQNRLASRPDYITLSGSGEPSLYSDIGRLIASIKSLTEIPVAVLTNGSLLWMRDVRGQLSQADLVIPSLDAGDEATFQAVNRPHSRISFAQMSAGLVDFRREYAGQYWLEIMVVAGHNATEERMGRIADCARRIQPDRIQLNTVTRPAAERRAARVSHERLTELARLFDPPAEVIADFHRVHQQPESAAGREEILALLERRPCAVGDIADGLKMHRNEVLKHLEELTIRGAVESSTIGSTRFYTAVRTPRSPGRRTSEP